MPWFVSIGLGLAALAVAVVLVSARWKKRHWRRTEGTVMSVKEQKARQSDGTTSSTYKNTYQFVDDVREKTRIGTKDTFFRSFRRKEQVPVRYDPTDPDQSEIATRGVLALWWAGTAALAVVGVVLIVLGYGDVLAQTS